MSSVFARAAALHINISAKSQQMLNLFMPSRLFVGYTHHRAERKLQHAPAEEQPIEHLSKMKTLDSVADVPYVSYCI